jgi:hypothetical protein
MFKSEVGNDEVEGGKYVIAAPLAGFKPEEVDATS